MLSSQIATTLVAVALGLVMAIQLAPAFGRGYLLICRHISTNCVI
jgi:hypothetical protein